MKKISIIILTLFLALSSCVIDDPSNPGKSYKSEGSITGYDMRMCACCGGWFITIDSIKYRFQNLPEGSNLDLEHAQFPVEVLLDWEKLENNPCTGDLIVVSRIKKK